MKWTCESSRRNIAPGVRHILKYKKSGTVLDLGSGKGKHSTFLAKNGFTVTAVDHEKEKLVVLKNRAKIEKVHIVTKCADIGKFRTSRKYNIVISTMVLHFLDKKQIPKVIARIKSYTKPDGLNLISVLTDKEPKGYRPHLFKKNELRKHYLDWSILEYEEKKSKHFYCNLTGKIIRQHRAVLIAQNS
ncbi:MAG: methyltransferase domain-containing protein [bacterium]|nr:methyltransferase domain-containing protein [bacterium]